MTTNVCVFCGASDGNDPDFTDTANELGQRLATEGFGLVYGAGGKGMMGALSDGALQCGGYVHGIIPKDMMAREWGRSDLTRLSIVDDIQQRKKRMYEESSAFITIPGGFGTLEEFFESLTWSQLGYHGSPKQSFILNVKGYYNHLVNMLDQAHDFAFVDKKSRALVTVVSTTDDLMKELQAIN